MGSGGGGGAADGTCSDSHDRRLDIFITDGGSSRDCGKGMRPVVEQCCDIFIHGKGARRFGGKREAA